MIRALQSRRVLTPSGAEDATVVFDDATGRIVEISERPPEGVAVEDVGERAILPGLVDAHVHINEPGRTEWEGFITATQAAAAGGVTTLVDMPLNCIPVTTTGAALEAKLAASEGELYVDVGFWGGVVPAHLAHLPELASGGALGAKAFLCHSGIDDFPASDEATLRAAMRALADAGLPLLAHAELEGATPPCDAPPTSYAAWLDRRPASWEDDAIALLIRLCRETGCAVHVVHLSAASSLPQIRAAKDEGLPLTVETCPHYLCLRAEDVPDGDTTYKCAPPIREDKNREALWGGLKDGTIDFVVTDHSPCTPHLKHLEKGDFVEAWGGISSLSLGLSSVWTEAKARGATLHDLVRWMSERPARFAGLDADKGALRAGAHADLVVLDPEASRAVAAQDLRFRHKVSPYCGRELRGVVHATWLRGQAIFDGSDVRGPLGAPLLHRRVRASEPTDTSESSTR